jgi:hypothetical protein
MLSKFGEVHFHYPLGHPPPPPSMDGGWQQVLDIGEGQVCRAQSDPCGRADSDSILQHIIISIAPMEHRAHESTPFSFRMTCVNLD